MKTDSHFLFIDLSSSTCCFLSFLSFFLVKLIKLLSFVEVILNAITIKKIFFIDSRITHYRVV